VKRVFSSVRAIVGLAIKENGIEITNPFASSHLKQKNWALFYEAFSEKIIFNFFSK
jgi:hypothetical protein